MSIREFKNKNSITYEVRFTYKDKYGRKQYYSKRGFTSRKKAKKHEELMKIKFAEGYAEKPKITLDKAFHECFDNNTTLAPATIVSREYAFKKHILPKIGNCLVETIDYKLVCDLIHPLETKYTKETVKNVLYALKYVLNYCYNMEYIDRMPFNKISLRGKEINRDNNKIVTDELFEQLISVSREHHKIAFYIAKYTGCRIGEVMALTRNDIDFTNDTININKTLYFNSITKELIIKSTKTVTSSAVIPLAKPLKDILVEWFKINPYDVVVSENGEYVNPTQIKSALQRFSKSHEHINFHMFRHTYSTTLFNADIDPKTAQKLLRHSDFNTTMSIYTHLKEESLKDTVDKVFN